MLKRRGHQGDTKGPLTQYAESTNQVQRGSAQKVENESVVSASKRRSHDYLLTSVITKIAVDRDLALASHEKADLRLALQMSAADSHEASHSGADGSMT